MIAYKEKAFLKILLLIIAILIGIGSLLYTNRLAGQLKLEEKKKVELWAAAMQQLINSENPGENISFLFRVIEGNTTVPLILVNEEGDTISTRNLNYRKLENRKYLEKQLEQMKAEHEPIEIVISEESIHYMYYKDSVLLTKLRYFPYVQLGVIILFVFVSYLAFSNSRKYEQNQVWVGLTKETAHQLGTPASSLNGWIDVLKLKKTDEKIIHELEKDVKRIEKITERFSRIGSRTRLEKQNIVPVLFNTVTYFKTRLSSQLKIMLNISEEDEIILPVNEALFEWVLENLIKNAADSTKGHGLIKIELSVLEKIVNIDIIDSGKGIPKSKFKTIFKPGFTTKERGWGLGLSLSRRIIEDYHKGKIFVERSDLNQGSCIRIVLKRS